MRSNNDFLGSYFGEEGNADFLATENSGYLPLRDGTIFALPGGKVFMWWQTVVTLFLL